MLGLATSGFGIAIVEMSPPGEGGLNRRTVFNPHRLGLGGENFC